LGCEAVATPDRPGRHQLGVSVQRRPRPHVAVAEGARVFLREVLRLCVDERPNLITLNPLALEVPQLLILIALTRGTRVQEKLRHSVDRDIGEAASRAKAATFREKTDDLGAALKRQSVHSSIVQRL